MDYSKSAVLIRNFRDLSNSYKESLTSESPPTHEIFGRILYEVTEEDILNSEVSGVGDWLNSSQSENGSLDLGESYVPYIERPETYIVPILFFIIFVIGVLGNGTLIVIFLKHRTMRNVPNIYICSLAVGDILVILFCVPFTSTVYTVESWPYGVIVCKFSEFIKDVSIGVSVFTLTALSADRYFAIVDPMRKLTGCRATRVTSVTIAAIWIVSVLIAVPSAMFSYIRVIDRDPTHTFHVCYPFPLEWTPIYPKVMVMFKFLVYYAIPLFFIATFYIFMARHLVLSTKNMPGEAQGQGKQIQARKKVAKMVLSFVVIFAMCFFPSHVFLLWFYFDLNSEENFNAFWNYVRIIGFCLGFMNSCINPITLYCLSGTFRKYFNRHLFCCCREPELERFRGRNVLACGAGCASMSNSAHPGGYMIGGGGAFNSDGLKNRNGSMSVRGGTGGIYRTSTTAVNYTASGTKNRCTWESSRVRGPPNEIQMTNLNVTTLSQHHPLGSPGHVNMPLSNNFPLTSISLASSPLKGNGHQQEHRFGILSVSPHRNSGTSLAVGDEELYSGHGSRKSISPISPRITQKVSVDVVEDVTVLSYIGDQSIIRIANIDDDDEA